MSDDDDQALYTPHRTHRIEPPNTGFEGWVWRGFVGLFAIGFIAWAAAVWNATDLVKVQAVRMEQIEREIAHIDNALTQHQLVPAHAGSAIQNAETRRDLQALQQQIDRRFDEIERRIEENRAESKGKR